MNGWRATTFGLDLRSLALCRIATGLVLIGDLISRATTFRLHYTDLGMLPRQAMYEIGIARFPSLYMASGWEGFVALLFLLHGLAALVLTLGYQTRLTSVVVWYLTISLQQRLYMANNGGDTVIALLLLWGMFVPWGERLSLDAAGKGPEGTGFEGETEAEGERALTPGTALFALQMPVVYWLSVFHKFEPVWLDGNVLYYAFQSDFYSRPLARLLLPYTALMKGLAYLTWAWEGIGPFLLLSSRWRLRLFACLAFMGMHLSFGLFLRIGTFALSPSLFLIALLPGEFWNFRIVREAARRWNAGLVRLAGRGGSRRAYLGAPRWTREGKAALFVLFLYGSMIALGQDSRVGRLVPSGLDWLAQLTGAYQRWSVFVNLPEVPDGWFVVEGRLSDGREVDLFQGFTPVRWDKPPTPYSRYDSFRWPTPMVVITGDARFRPWFVRALALDWEAEHPGQKVTWARLNWMREKTAPDWADTPAQRHILWEGDPHLP